VLAALEMLDLLEGFNRQQAALEKSQIRIGIGIASGKMMRANTGTEYRAVYTCVGDTVNLAARLEDYTKQAGKPILIDRNTCDRLAESITVESLGRCCSKANNNPFKFIQLQINSLGRHHRRLFSYIMPTVTNCAFLFLKKRDL